MDRHEVDVYNKLSLKIKDQLGLDKSPVAIKLVSNNGNIPEGISKIEGNFRHCEMVQKALQGEIFYSTAKEQQLCNGAGALGLTEPSAGLKSGEMHYSMGKFSSKESAKRTVNAIPKIENIMKAVVYAPLETTPYAPDIVIIICNPQQAMRLSQSMVYTLNDRFLADFAGIQSVCGDAVAGPYNTKRPNITLGCDASRKFADIKPYEVIVGMNSEDIGFVVNALDELNEIKKS
ncbi:DUF169 domain-containing protein [Methanobacterium sp.]|uniref:DUF169 domain-containing protein n=1 Tax=Methanobacterium sp. TaxID=2164 RepID=UPI003C714800